MERATLGDCVTTLGGELVGRVEQVMNGGIRVRTPAGDHLDLGPEAIFGAGFRKVVLVCERGGLADYQDLYSKLPRASTFAT